MFDYLLKFLVGGTILALATYFGKSKDLFWAGIITTIPLMTIANMTLQMRLLDPSEFRAAQRSGIFGALGLFCFIGMVYLLTQWLKPPLALLLSVALYLGYLFLLKHLA